MPGQSLPPEAQHCCAGQAGARRRIATRVQSLSAGGVLQAHCHIIAGQKARGAQQSGVILFRTKPGADSPTVLCSITFGNGADLGHILSPSAPLAPVACMHHVMPIKLGSRSDTFKGPGEMQAVRLVASRAPPESPADKARWWSTYFTSLQAQQSHLGAAVEGAVAPEGTMPTATC